MSFSERLKKNARWMDPRGNPHRIDFQDASDHLREKGMLPPGSTGDGTFKNYYYGKHEPVPYLQEAIVKEIRALRETLRKRIS